MAIKLIIDTDPGIGEPSSHELCFSQSSTTRPCCVPADDSMAILAAFNSPEIEIIGLTTIFGNVPTPMATANALYLTEIAGRQVCLSFHRLVHRGESTAARGTPWLKVEVGRGTSSCSSEQWDGRHWPSGPLELHPCIYCTA